MVVYADILICLNAFVNYFLLLITAKVYGERVRGKRHVLAAVVGALFSLYIFVPIESFLLEILVRLAFSAVIVLTGFPFHSLKKFLCQLGLFYAITFLYAGLMMGVWFLFRPNGMAIRNGVVYFNITPLILIATTILCYGLIQLFRRLTKRQAGDAKRVEIVIALGGARAKTAALVDTGHSLYDSFSGVPVVIIEKSVAKRLLQQEDVDLLLKNKQPLTQELRGRFRLIPYQVIDGEGLLPAFRCDSVCFENGQVRDIVVAVSKSQIGDDYGAIINPALLQMGGGSDAHYSV